jgi:hypothetical protein
MIIIILVILIIIINTYSYIMLYHAISCYISTSTAIYIYIDVFFVAQPLVLAPLAPAGWVQALPLGDREDPWPFTMPASDNHWRMYHYICIP